MKKKYSTITVEKPDATYVFVTRGRSKPFSDAEIQDFFGPEEVEIENEFKVEGHLRRIFAQDLQYGIAHCKNKYGASEEAIMAEAKRLFPHQNLSRIIGTYSR